MASEHVPSWKSLPVAIAALLLATTAVAIASSLFLAGSMLASDQPTADLSWAESLTTSLTGALFAAVGVLIVARRGNHVVGWAAVATGLFLVAFEVVDLFTLYSFLPDQNRSIGLAAKVAAGARQSTWLLFIGAFGLLALYYPTGQLPSPRWKLPLWTMAVFVLGVALFGMFIPIRLEEPLDLLPNPLGISSLEPIADYFMVVGLGGVFASIFAIGGNMLFRAWRSTNDEREQFKWFAVSVTLFIGANIFINGDNMVSRIATVLAFVGLIAVPLSIGAAILKYRLYEIDVVIGRTLVYAPLTAILAGTYSASVLLFRFLFVGATGSSSSETIVLTTLVVAAMFLPVKNRLQSQVDHLFKEDERKRLNAYVRDLEHLADLLEPKVALKRFAQRASGTTGFPVKVVVFQSTRYFEHPEGAAHSPDPMIIPLATEAGQIGRIELSGARLRAAHVDSVKKGAPSLARIARFTKGTSEG